MIPRDKILRYLLAPEHPEGGGKARFFRERGYQVPRYREGTYALDKPNTPQNVDLVACSILG